VGPPNRNAAGQLCRWVLADSIVCSTPTSRTRWTNRDVTRGDWRLSADRVACRSGIVTLVSSDGDGGIPAIRHPRLAAITERTFRELRLASLANLRADSRARRSTVRVILLYRRISNRGRR